MGDLYDLVKSGGSKGGSGGGSKGDSLYNAVKGGTTAKAAAPSKKGDSKKSFFGLRLPTVFGVNLPDIGFSASAPGPIAQIRDVVAGAGPALARMGGTLLSEGAAQHGGEKQGLLDRLFRPAPGQSRTVPLFDPAKRRELRESSPMSYELLTSPARTARQVPDTLAAIRPGGPGFGQSDLGQQIREEGYLSTLLAKGGDIAVLAGGVGVLGRAATESGRLAAQAGRLERLAGLSSEAAGLGRTPNFGKLTKAAGEAEAVGDAARAADLAAAAKQVLQAAELRTGLAGAGKGARAAAKVTEGAGKVSRGFDRASALPFVPTQKLAGALGKGAGALARGPLAPAMVKAEAAVARLQQRQGVGDLYHETVRAPFEAEMQNWYERHGLEDVARKLDRDEQAAVYMARMTREGLDPAVRELLDAIDELPDEVRPDAVRHLFPDGEVTPEQYALARAFEDGTLPEAQAAKLQDAADRIAAAQTQRQTTRYETGRGTSRQLSDAALTARRQRAAGESAAMDVDAVVERKTAATQGRLSRIRSEIDELNTAPDPAPVPRSRAQERSLAKLAERTRRREATVKGETERGKRLMETAGREVERNATRADNRTGQVIGRARGRLEEAGQLQTGVERRARADALKAKRLAKQADAAKREPAKTLRRQEADVAAAEAAKLKGVKQPSLAKVRSDVNLDAQRANVASRAEQGTANRLLAKQVEDQRAAVAKAQKQLDAAQAQERATLDRFERENQARADKAQQKRFEQLQKREADALAKLADEAEAARNSVEAAPPQDRPALRVGERAKQLALALASAHPEHASRFEALAGDIATTKAQLEAKGIKTEYIFGGAELGDVQGVPATARLRRPKKLQSERQRTKGVLARSVKAQGEKFAAETKDILHNEFRGRMQERMGSKAGDEIAVERFATGEDIAAQLAEADLVAWNPKTGKLLDAKDIDKNSAVLPKPLHDAVTKWTAVREPGLLLRVYDRATGGWKHTVLALSPRWHIGNIVGNAALATLGAGLSPFDIAQNIGEARRLVKAFESGGDVPAEHVSSLQRILAAGYHNPDLATVENARAVGRLINKSYHFNSYVDNVNRTMVYLAKHKKGVSAEAAVTMALKAAGDFSKMTPFERNVIRRVIPFYAWQRHITRLALSLPIEHPTRVVWTLHLADLQDQMFPDPGAENEFNEGTVAFGGKRLNVRQFFPFTSSFWSDPTYRGAGYQVNPILKTGVAAATGFNVGKMKPVSSKENKGGFGAPMQFLAKEAPGTLAQFAAQQVPFVSLARDLAAGGVPVRYDTGQPRKVGPGATKKGAKPTLTGRGRKETLARFAGVPIPEKEQKPVTKKKKD